MPTAGADEKVLNLGSKVERLLGEANLREHGLHQIEQALEQSHSIHLKLRK